MSLLDKILTFAVTVVLGLTLAVSVASAGSFEDGKYSGNLGYTFVPPEGWIKYDASTASALPGIPENLRDVNFSRFDVVFFQPPKKFDVDTLSKDSQRVEDRKKAINAGTRPAPGTPEGDALDKSEAEERKSSLPQSPEFGASIAIMVVQHVPTNVSSETANAYAESLKQNISDMISSASDITIKKATSDEIHGSKALLFSLDMRNRGQDLRVEQAIITNDDDKSIVVTCISDNNELMPDKNWCAKATNSVRFK